MKLIRLTYPTSHTDSVHRAIDGSAPVDWSREEEPSGTSATAQILLEDGAGQTLMDALQSLFTSEDDWRLVLMDVEATLPRLTVEDEPDKPASKPKDKDVAMREVLFEQVSKDSRLNTDFVVLTVLSAVVAAIGLNGDSVAVVIAAMVIAPLLGPILGFSLGSALGSTDLMRKSAATALVGVGIGFVTVLVLAVIFPINLESEGLIARTIISPEIVALALASGAAAALSMTGGLSSTLVGVMVAVALLPPSAASAMYLGEGQYTEAAAAAILVALNVVCALLSAQIVFAWKGVRPRRWLAQKAVERQQKINYAVWAALLAILFGLGYWVS